MGNPVSSFDGSSLEGVLVYVCTKIPVKKYKSEAKQFKVGVVVTEDVAEAFGDIYPKQEAKAVKTSEFEELYKIAPPFPDQRKQFIITLKKGELLANGEPVPEKYKPKVFQKNAAGRVEQIDVLVANGSTGKVSLDIFESKEYGTFARLKNVLVTNLIEYKQTGGDAGSEFGEVESGGSEFEASTPEPTPTPKASKPTKAKRPVEELEDDSAPF